MGTTPEVETVVRLLDKPSAWSSSMIYRAGTDIGDFEGLAHPHHHHIGDDALIWVFGPQGLPEGMLGKPQLGNNFSRG
jgi:hypothetical protein